MQNQNIRLLLPLVILTFCVGIAGCGKISQSMANRELIGKWNFEEVKIDGKKVEKNASAAAYSLGEIEFLEDGTAAFTGQEWEFRLKSDGYLRLETKSATLMMKATIKGELLTLEYGGREYTYRKAK